MNYKKTMHRCQLKRQSKLCVPNRGRPNGVGADLVRVASDYGKYKTEIRWYIAKDRILSKIGSLVKIRKMSLETKNGVRCNI